MGVSQVGIRVRSTKVGLGDTVLDGRLVETESIDKDGSTVRTSDTIEGIEEDSGFRGGVVKPVLDHVKVEDLLEKVDVVGDWVDDSDLQWSMLKFSNFGQVELSCQHVAPLDHSRQEGRPTCTP